MTENERVAIVTGGSRGIGRETAARLGRGLRGSGRVLGGARARPTTRSRRSRQAGGRAIAVQADVADESRGGRAVRPDRGGLRRGRRGGALGRRHAAVAAGRAGPGRTSTRSSGPTCAAPSWSTSRPPAGCATAARSSTSPARSPSWRGPGYSAPTPRPRAASRRSRLILARELRGRNITVNAVAPGPTATALFLDGKPQELIDRIAAEPPLERLGQPEDIAEVISFLAGRGRWINGQVIYANGGSAA